MEDQQVTNTDVVGGNGDSVGWGGRDNTARGSFRTANVNILPVMVAAMAAVVVVRATYDTVSGAMETMAEGVVVT